MANKSFYVPSVEAHLIASQYVDQTYQIQVMQPLMRKGANERFPVLYITDGNLAFDTAKGISHALQAAGLVRRFILVGIGYPGDNPFAGNVLRGRDLTSDWYPDVPDIPRTSPIDGVAGLGDGERNLHGASGFLAFIRHELIVFVDKAYPTIAGDRAYFGHSGGGGLGLHALFSDSGLFKRFVISSPGIAYDGYDFGIREARQYIESGKPLYAKVVMTVGEREECEPHLAKWQLVTSVSRLANLLRAASILGFDFASSVIPGETHMSVWPIAFSHGVQAIYGPAQWPPTASGEG
jgi:predicted alpha/beta superfamily hydrolase